MKKYLNITITTGLAIFAMLFGAANLIFPVKVGVISGHKTLLGLSAFVLSGTFDFNSISNYNRTLLLSL